MDEERLRGLRVALKAGERLIERQLAELQEQVRLGETLLRVSVALVAAESALLGVFLAAGAPPRPAVLSFLTGIILMAIAVVRLVLLTASTTEASLGPDLQGLAAAAMDADLSEEGLTMSLVRNLNLHFVRNSGRIDGVARKRAQAALAIAGSASMTSLGLVYMAGGTIIG